MSLIGSLKWRYATKKFDPTKKVSAADLAQLKEAIQLAASSYGLQSYTVLIIQNPSIQTQLKAASWGQSQLEDASHVFVFCANTSVTKEQIDQFIAHKSATQGIPLAVLGGYGDLIKSKLGELSAEEIKIWASKQTYIALGNLMVACGELKIDACPMEGFEADKYNAILDLTDKGLTAEVVATIGYRSAEDRTQFLPKVRKSEEALFVNL